MKRKISDKHAAIIKKMLSENYKTASIKDFMRINHGVVISGVQIYSIKRLETYREVRPELNDSIGKFYVRRGSDVAERISGIKFALANGFSDEDIIKEYQVKGKELLRIKLGQLPYYSISPEYNSEIDKRRTRIKVINIDSTAVTTIKKEFADKNGDVILQKIAKKHKIDKATVSTILSFKFYKEFGAFYNSKIDSINKEKEARRNDKKRERVKVKIEREKLKRDALIQKKKQIVSQEKQINTKIKELKDSLPGRTVSATTD